jgi:hypothetical protein
LVQLLQPGSSALPQQAAACALTDLAVNAATAFKIVEAGAIPLLVKLEAPSAGLRNGATARCMRNRLLEARGW